MTLTLVIRIQDLDSAGIKPNNIMVDCESGSNGTLIRRVQLADLEDAVHVPRNKAIAGKPFGKGMWRSPEAHAETQVNKYSDMFSFALVVSHPSHLNALSRENLHVHVY